MRSFSSLVVAADPIDGSALCATVIHYRPRMAIREVGKVMGLSEDITSALAKTIWGSWGKEVGEKEAA